MMQNIGFDNQQDDNYRYKMPTMIIKVEGKGNGIKTIITNLDAISLALNRNPDIILKYFSFSLGTIAEKNNIIKGPHKIETLNELLNTFISKYVQCSKCSIPETFYNVDKNILTINCKACGYGQPADKSKISEYIFKKIKKS
jgi:translation initiation factor 5